MAAIDDDWQREVLLDHGHHPRHDGLLGTYDHIERGTSPDTGDRVVLTVRIEDGRLAELGCMVQGSVVLRASTSLMGEAVTGLSLADARARARAFVTLLTGPAEQANWEGWGEVAALQGIQRLPARVRCAVLPWRTLDALLTRESG